MPRVARIEPRVRMTGPIATGPSEPPQTAPPGATRTLDGALVRGIAWTGGVRWTGQIVAWISTLIVARLLTPSDYGLVGMASIYLGLVTLFSEFGIGATIVSLRDLTDEQVAQIHTLSLLFGITGFAISCVVSVPLSWFFGEPQLPPVVIALSLAFVITALRTVPYALLQRELRFKFLALVDGAQALLSALSMIAFAALGLRYWTLVLGTLLSAAISTGVVAIARPQRFAWPRLQSVRHAVAFSGYVLVDRFAWYVSITADLIVTGKILGRQALGAYGLASSLANAPTEKVTALLGSVTSSVFSAVQTEQAALRRYLLSLTEGLSLLTFPATLGMAFVAHDFVLAVLGEKWRAIIVPLQLLAISAAIRSVAPLIPQVLFVTGEAKFVMRNSLRAAVLLPIAFYVGSRWGTAGIAASWIVVYPLVATPLYWRVFRKLDLPATHYLRSLWPALIGVALMGIAIWSLNQMLPHDWPLALRAGVQIAAGGIVYLMVLLSMRRDRLRALYQTLKLVPR